VIDFGSGPGTAVWAVARHWPKIKRYILVEPSDAMVEISTKLLEGFPVERRRYLHQGRQDPVDLVTASYSLSELGDDQMRRAHIRALWSAVNPGGILLLLEPGTPVGFKIIRAARSLILDLKTDDKSTNPVIVGPVRTKPTPTIYEPLNGLLSFVVHKPEVMPNGLGLVVSLYSASSTFATFKVNERNKEELGE